MQESSPSPALSVAEDFASKIYPRAQLTERGLPEWAKKALPSDKDAPATTEANNSDNTASNNPRLDKKAVTFLDQLLDTPTAISNLNNQQREARKPATTIKIYFVARVMRTSADT